MDLLELHAERSRMVGALQIVLNAKLKITLSEFSQRSFAVLAILAAILILVKVTNT